MFINTKEGEKLLKNFFLVIDDWKEGKANNEEVYKALGSLLIKTEEYAKSNSAEGDE